MDRLLLRIHSLINYWLVQLSAGGDRCEDPAVSRTIQMQVHFFTPNIRSKQSSRKIESRMAGSDLLTILFFSWRALF